MTDKIPEFSSFFWSGFECSSPLVENGERWDLLKESRHDSYCQKDYQMIKELGITTVREGLAWYKIDKGNGKYDYSFFEVMMEIARKEGIQQIWDFNHYDYPLDLDPFSQEFIDRFSAYAVETAKVIKKYQKGTIYVVLFNEISYMAWIAGDLGKWAPYTKGVKNGIKLKSQLIRATIAATDAIRKEYDDVRFIQVDPFMYREAIEPAFSSAKAAAHDFNEVARFQTWDMLSGKTFPELGGDPKYLDILGINYYIDNQQWLISSKETKQVIFERVPLDSPKRKSLTEMLQQIYPRYKRPIVLAETGSYGDLRPAWWKHLLYDLQECINANVPVYGVCSYPTVDNPDEGHFLAPHSGLWDFKPGDKTYARYPHEETLMVIKPYIQEWNRIYKS